MRRTALVMLLIAGSYPLSAETPPVPHATEESAALTPGFLQRLSEIVPSSGLIFSGSVLQVRRHNLKSITTLATTAIQFRVENAVRGVRNGQILQIKEWGGLWQSGETYRPGQRVLLFLYPPSKLGLTSPVANGLGRFSVNQLGHVLVKSGAGPAKPIAIQRVVAAIREAEKR